MSRATRELLGPGASDVTCGRQVFPRFPTHVFRCDPVLTYACSLAVVVERRHVLAESERHRLETATGGGLVGIVKKEAHAHASHEQPRRNSSRNSYVRYS